VDEEWKDALRNFAEVWGRVHPEANTMPELPSAPAAPGKPRGAELLHRSLLWEWTMAAHYAAVANLCPGRSGETLRTLAADCRGCRKRLKAEYFLLTGEQVRFTPPRLPHDGLPGYLRRAYLAESAGEREYLSAASEAEQPGLGEMFRELAEHCARRRESLRELVRRIME